MLLIMLILIPLIGAFTTLFIRNKSINIPFLASISVILLGGVALKDVFGGSVLTYRMSASGPFVPVFHADALSSIFVMLAAFLWLVISIYAPDYMKCEGKVKSYNLCTLLTFTAVLGVFLAGNLLTMLLFFEMMTISSYFWVIHRGDNKAIKAGYFYIFFGIIGGLFLALGIVLMGASVGELPSIGASSIDPLNPQLFAWAITLFILGFGIKAGMAPVHVWLPHAHSAAPTPGSALLSGLLIKVGAYGLIRTGQFVGWGLGSGADRLGPILTILGVCTMLVGVLSALLQSDAKRLLAYHSVSQMGYIILGLGTSLYLGIDGGLGLMGSVYHIFNHALFKVALFLGMGIVYMHTKETNLYKLGGLLKKLPVTAILMFLAVLGITGTPGLNGYASKTLLHHAVDLTAEKGALWGIWTQRLFFVVGVGTTASFAKLYYLTFLGKPKGVKVSDFKAPKMQLATGILTFVMLIIGIFPKLFLNLNRALADGILGGSNANSLIDNLSFWNKDDIWGMCVTLALGILVCWAGLKSGAFHFKLPSWLTFEGLGFITAKGVYKVWGGSVKLATGLVLAVVRPINTVANRLNQSFNSFSKTRSGTIGKINLTGISADAALLVLVLTLLIVWYILIDPGLPSLKMPVFMRGFMW